MQSTSNKHAVISSLTLLKKEPLDDTEPELHDELKISMMPQRRPSTDDQNDSQEESINRKRRSFFEDLEAKRRSTSNGNQKKYFLQRFVDGVICGQPIDTEKLGFPISIGRDVHQVKVLIHGRDTKHVGGVHAHVIRVNGELCVFSYSKEGVMVNGEIFVGRGNSYRIEDGDSFTLGGQVNENSGRREITFAVLLRDIVPPVKTEIIEEPDTGHSTYNAIFISDDEEEVLPAEVELSFKREVVEECGSESGSSDVNLLLSDVTSVASTTPVCQTEDKRISSSETQAYPLSVQIDSYERENQSSQTRSFEAGDLVCDRSDSLLTSAATPRREDNYTSIQVVPMDISPQRDLGFSNDYQPSTREVQFRNRERFDRRHSESPVFRKKPLSGSRKSKDWHHSFKLVKPNYYIYQRAILGLDLNHLEYDDEQECERPFKEYISGCPRTNVIGAISRKLFSYFVLEACARIKITWLRSEPFQSFRLGAVTAQQRWHNGESMRLQIVLLLDNPSTPVISEYGAVRMRAQLIRFGGRTTKTLNLFGAVQKCVRIDRRDRSGGVQLPAILLEKARTMNAEFVDMLDIDFNGRDFADHKLLTMTPIGIQRLCDIRECRKVACLRNISKSFCSFLRFKSTSNMWSPMRSERGSRSCQPQISRITRTSNLTSEQTAAVCGVITFMHATLAPVTTFMLIEGAAGSGKTRTLVESSIEAALAMPSSMIIVFCKWSVAADAMTLLIKEQAEYREEESGVQKLTVCRGGKSCNPRLSALTIRAHQNEHATRKMKERIAKVEHSLRQQQKQISECNLSLEDQLETLSRAVKKKKLDEIKRLESLYEGDLELLKKLKSQLEGADSNRSAKQQGRDGSYQGINILVCASADIENNILVSGGSGNTRPRVPVVLMDQAHQIHLVDLVPFMQLQCDRIVMFGDSSQSDFMAQTVRHPFNQAAKPFAPSEFVSLRLGSPGVEFRLTRQFRLKKALFDAVNYMFYNSTLVESDRRSTTTQQTLSSLRAINIKYPEHENWKLSFHHVLLNTALAIRALHAHCHLVRAGPNEQLLPSGFSDQLKERNICMISKTAQLLDTEDVNVLIFPTFDEALVSSVRNDPALLCSLMTRPKHAFILLGDFNRTIRDCHPLDDLIRYTQQTHSYFVETPTAFFRKSPETLLRYFK